MPRQLEISLETEKCPSNSTATAGLWKTRPSVFLTCFMCLSLKFQSLGKKKKVRTSSTAHNFPQKKWILLYPSGLIFVPPGMSLQFDEELHSV